MIDGEARLKQQIQGDLAGAIAERLFVETLVDQPGGGFEKTAYHEAGHAMVSIFFGRWPVRIEIFPNGSGRVHYVWGGVGQPFGPPDDVRIGEKVAVLNDLCDSPVALPQLERDTEALLRGSWRLVERIAAALISRCIGFAPGEVAVLSGSEIRMICKTTLEKNHVETSKGLEAGEGLDQAAACAPATDPPG